MPTTKGPSMTVIAEKLDTLTEDVSTIRETVQEIKEVQIANEVHMKAIIGPPSLEDKLRSYVDGRDDHKAASAQQALLQTQTILQLEQKNSTLELRAEIHAAALAVSQTETQRAKDQEGNHKAIESSNNRLKAIERNMYLFMGGLTVLQFVADALLVIYFKK